MQPAKNMNRSIYQVENLQPFQSYLTQQGYALPGENAPHCRSMWDCSVTKAADTAILMPDPPVMR